MGKIKTQDWLATIAEARNRGRLPEGRTTREIAAALGLSQSTAIRMCRTKVAAHQWQRGWDYRERADGAQLRVTVYAPIHRRGKPPKRQRRRK